MSLAQEIFEDAFNRPRDPRSEPYKAGVLDALRYHLGELKSLQTAMPYEMGTAEADAWFAGVLEGKTIFCELQELGSGETTA
ncbi:MAG TPA: hypothetical protein ENK05_11675 [Gammaproteobacteria bacterium]|nr:hypothetical protein [Gammaproteobacteria bacterium]